MIHYLIIFIILIIIIIRSLLVVINFMSPIHRYGSRTALHLATQLHRLAVIPRLLAAPGVAVDMPDKGDHTALWLAAWEGSDEAVTALLAAGADPLLAPHHGEDRGLTPLDIARREGKESVADLIKQHLLNHGEGSVR